MKPSPDQIFEDVAGRDKPGLTTSIKTYFMRHAQVFFYSLGQLWRTPFSMLMTAAVIGIALALPTGMHVLLNNAQQLSGGWDGAAKVSLYLKAKTTDEQARGDNDVRPRHDESSTNAWTEHMGAAGEQSATRRRRAFERSSANAPRPDRYQGQDSDVPDPPTLPARQNAGYRLRTLSEEA